MENVIVSGTKKLIAEQNITVFDKEGIIIYRCFLDYWKAEGKDKKIIENACKQGVVTSIKNTAKSSLKMELADWVEKVHNVCYIDRQSVENVLASLIFAIHDVDLLQTNSPVPKPEVEADTAEQMHAKAVKLANKKQYSQAMALWEKSAALGYVEAQYRLGCCYESGDGVAEDEYMAFHWQQLAANQGHAAAQRFLGYCYECGAGTGQNETKAAQWYRKSANQGYAAAQYNLAECYVDGVGVKQNTATAASWFKKAAKQNYENAQQKYEECMAEVADNNSTSYSSYSTNYRTNSNSYSVNKGTNSSHSFNNINSVVGIVSKVIALLAILFGIVGSVFWIWWLAVPIALFILGIGLYVNGAVDDSDGSCIAGCVVVSLAIILSACVASLIWYWLYVVPIALVLMAINIAVRGAVLYELDDFAMASGSLLVIATIFAGILACTVWAWWLSVSIALLVIGGILYATGAVSGDEEFYIYGSIATALTAVLFGIFGSIYWIWVLAVPIALIALTVVLYVTSEIECDDIFRIIGHIVGSLLAIMIAVFGCILGVWWFAVPLALLFVGIILHVHGELEMEEGCSIAGCVVVSVASLLFAIAGSIYWHWLFAIPISLVLVGASVGVLGIALYDTESFTIAMSIIFMLATILLVVMGCVLWIWWASVIIGLLVLFSLSMIIALMCDVF